MATGFGTGQDQGSLLSVLLSSPLRYVVIETHGAEDEMQKQVYNEHCSLPSTCVPSAHCLSQVPSAAQTFARMKLSITERFGRLEKLNEEDHQLNGFPWRICLAGGWLDQPWVSEISAGSCIVLNVHPHQQFKTRSGLATSTRTYGMKLWGTLAGGRPPVGEKPEDLALMLFGAENPPGCKYVAGSQV